MKRIYSYFSAVVSFLCVFGGLAYAQDSTDKGVVLNKYVTGPENGQYKLTLEAYATGSSITQKVTKPMDLVLVLDLSGSMKKSYKTLESKSYTYTDITDGTYFYLVKDNNYDYCYPVYKKVVNSTDRWGNEKTSYQLCYRNGTTDTVFATASSQTATIYTGSFHIRRIEALKSAAASFISAVKESAEKDNVNHRISIVTFGAFLSPSIGFNTWEYSGWNPQPMSQIVNDLESVKTNSQDLIDSVNGFIEGGSTPSDWGLMLANCVLNGNFQYNDHYEDYKKYAKSAFGGYSTSDGYYNSPNDFGLVPNPATQLTRFSVNDPNVQAGANKVVVFFTDGSPYMEVSGYYRNVKDYAVKEAKKLKDSGAVVYSVAVLGTNEDTATIMDASGGKSSYGSYTNGQFLNYVSSNYTTSTTSDVSMATPGVLNTDGDYYKLASGNLEQIFVEIAKEATSGGASAKLNESTTVLDVLTSDFTLPATANASDIKVYVDPAVVTEVDLDTYDPRTVAFDTENRQPLSNPNIVITRRSEDDPNSKESISVKGFNFTSADTNASTGPWGNWVGPRTSGGISKIHGNRLVITFPIKTIDDYQGGYTDYTNTDESGIYSDGEAVEKFPRPYIDFPSIGIIKKGLRTGESAVFSVKLISSEYRKDENGDPILDDEGYKQFIIPTIGSMTDPDYHVVLTGTSDDGSAPVYALIKDIPEGVYWIKEETWSWTYTGQAEGETGNTSIRKRVLVGNQVQKWSTYNITETLPKCVLYVFENTKKTDLPLNGEAFKVNTFTTSSVAAPSTSDSSTNTGTD